MWDVLLDALIDSLKILPVLLIVYILIELLELKTAGKLKHTKILKGKWAPLIGAGIGIVPQCGFSVVATDLYTTKAISVGTLLSVYIATSDEAVPILLSNFSAIKYLWPLLLIKFVLAVLVGYCAYFIFRNKKQTSVFDMPLHSVINSATIVNEKTHNENDTQNISQRYLVADYNLNDEKSIDVGCCGHDIEGDTHKLTFWGFMKHPILHSLKIFSFILIVNVILGLLIYWVGLDNLNTFMETNRFIQPFVVGLVGLIPNCASSVLITELLVSNSITFGAALAGLCVNAGIGMAVLIKQNKNKLDTFFIIASLYIISVLVGYLVTFVGM